MSRVVSLRAAGRCDVSPPAAGAVAGLLLLGLPSLLAAGSPELAAWLEYDRARVAAGELWRLVTCHWSHWSPSQLLWDLGSFAILFRLCLRTLRARTWVTLGAATVAISAAVWSGLPAIARYRGLSGVDSALFALLALSLLLRARGDGDRWLCAGLGLTLVAFAVKVGFEFASGTTIFADDALFVPVPLAHLVGGLVGIAVAAWPRRAVAASARSPAADSG